MIYEKKQQQQTTKGPFIISRIRGQVGIDKQLGKHVGL